MDKTVKSVRSVPSGTITSVKFTGVYDKGSYFPDTEEWTNRSISTGETDAKGVFEVALPAGGVAVGAGSNGTSLTTAETSFMMIPQQLFTGAEIVVGFTDGATNKTYTLRAGLQGDVWAMNTTTNYIINIDANYNLTIVPLDKTLDSHYIMTRVEVSSEYPNWSVSVVANDGAEVTVQKESIILTMERTLTPKVKTAWKEKMIMLLLRVPQRIVVEQKQQVVQLQMKCLLCLFLRI